MNAKRSNFCYGTFLCIGMLLGLGQGLGYHSNTLTFSFLLLICIACVLPFTEVKGYLHNGVLGAACIWGFGIVTSVIYIVYHTSNLFFNAGICLLCLAGLSMLLFTVSAVTNWSLWGAHPQLGRKP